MNETIDLRAIGQRVKDARLSRGMRQRDLAREVSTLAERQGVERESEMCGQRVCQIEGGNVSMRMPELALVASVLGVSTDHLVYGKAKARK
jgi:transcriptional regulator with XRE-family HTH domain